MSWKNCPYWLKGGVILSVIALLLHMFFYVLIIRMGGLDPVFGNIGGNGLIYIPFIVIFYFGSAIVGFGGLGILGLFLWIAVNCLFHFVLGSIIGLIYGKTKNIIK